MSQRSDQTLEQLSAHTDVKEVNQILARAKILVIFHQDDFF